MTELWKSYAVRVIGPSPSDLSGEQVIESADLLLQAVSEAEENISDLLPEGWYVKIEDLPREEN